MEFLDPIKANNVLIDLENASMEETRDRWDPAYCEFIKTVTTVNGTFCLHHEVMQQCDEIVANSASRKNRRKTGIHVASISCKIFSAVCFSQWRLIICHLLCQTNQ